MLNSTAIGVTWEFPRDPRAPITGFIVSVSVGSERQARKRRTAAREIVDYRVSASKLFYVVGGLEQNVSYEVSLRSVYGDKMGVPVVYPNKFDLSEG